MRSNLRHVEGQLGREGAGRVEVLLRRVDVGPDEDLVEDAGLELAVDEALVVLHVAQHERVRDGALQELGGDVRTVALLLAARGNLERGSERKSYTI